jgi:uncharacterized protein YgiM (DUF1202 family)
MKKNCWLLFGAMLSTSLLAQPVTNPPPSAPIQAPPPAPAVASVTPSRSGTNVTAAKAGKKKAGATKKSATKAAATTKKAPAAELKSVPLVAGPASVLANNVNVRGKAGFKGEVVAHLTKGQQVTVLEEIARNDSGPDEPSAWAKIALPADVHVWVSGAYVDSANKTVKATKLRLRGGAGENFSVLGELQKGDAVKELSTKGDWLEIEAPTSAYAFVAAEYLKQEAPGAPVTPAAAPPVVVAAAQPPEEAPVAESPTMAAPPTEPPVVATPPVETPTVTTPAVTTPAAETGTVTTPAITTREPVVQEPPPKRIVQREGVVRGTVSIQAPTQFELVSVDTHRTIDYLYTTSPDLDLRRWKGYRVIVVGEEALDERWLNTPVITIQKIIVVSDAAQAP